MEIKNFKVSKCLGLLISSFLRFNILKFQRFKQVFEALLEDIDPILPTCPHVSTLPIHFLTDIDPMCNIKKVFVDRY